MSTEKEAKRDQTWECTIQGEKKHGAYGTRDILIIYQDENLQREDIVRRVPSELTNNDQRQLQWLNLPPDQWKDDASIMAARYNMDPDYDITEVIRSKPGELLTAKYARKQIEILMNNTQKGGSKP